MDQHHFLAAVREVVLGRTCTPNSPASFCSVADPGGRASSRCRTCSQPGLRARAFDYRPSRNLNVRLADDVLRYSTPNLLRYEDKNSMAFSIESRVRSWTTSWSNSSSSSDRPEDQDGWNRYVYRQAMKAKMPELNRTRRSKIGFTNPRPRGRESGPSDQRIFSSSALCSRGIFDSAT